MVNFNRNEIVSATQLVRQFSTIMSSLINKTLSKIAIIRNNEMEAVILSFDEYEYLLLSDASNGIYLYSVPNPFLFPFK